MTLKNSYSSYFKNTLKRKSWLFALSGLCFFLSLTLPALIMIGAANEQNISLDFQEKGDLIFQQQFFDNLIGLMNHNGFAIKAVFVILAIIAGVSAFAYLHNKSKVDFYNSFPISRKSMFSCNFLASIIPVLAGFLVNFILTHIIIVAFGYGEALISASIWIALAENLLYFISTFSIVAVCTLLCGNTIIALILSLVALFGHVATYGLFCAIKYILYPVYYFGEFEDFLGIIRISPATFTFGTFLYADGNLTPRLILLAVYIPITIGIIALGLFCFKKHKSESSGIAIAIDKLRLPLKIYCCIIFGLGFAYIFTSFVNSTIWIFIGLIFGILIAHMLSEIVFDFNFASIFKNWKHSVLIMVCCCSIVLCMNLDITGFNTRTMKAENVKSFGFRVTSEVGQTLNERNLDSEDNIAVITEIIKRAANYPYQGHDATHGMFNFYLAVNTKPFGEFKRGYRLAMTEDNIALFNQIRYSEEYKKETSDLFLEKLDKSTYVTVRDAVNSVENVKTVGGENVQKLLTSMREEYLNLSIEQGHYVIPLCIVYFKVDDREYGVPVYSSYTNTLAILEQEDFTSTKLNADDIKKIAVDNYDIEQVKNSVESLQDKDSFEYNDEVTEFTDKADIEALIRNACNGGTYRYVDYFGNTNRASIEIFFNDKEYSERYEVNGKDIYDVVKK